MVLVGFVITTIIVGNDSVVIGIIVISIIVVFIAARSLGCSVSCCCQCYRLVSLSSLMCSNIVGDCGVAVNNDFFVVVPIIVIIVVGC